VQFLVADAGDEGDTIAYREAPALVSQWEGLYASQRSMYELGEYGLPDDGYDYSKHFKRIGGGAGSVFVEKGGRTDAGGQGCDQVDAVVIGEQASREDDARRKRLIQSELELQRKGDRELDVVLAALEESSEDDDAGGIESEEDLDELDDIGLSRIADAIDSDSELELDDEFVSKARALPNDLDSLRGRAGEGIEGSSRPNVAGATLRKARLLDDQFDQLMRSYGGTGEGSGDEESGTSDTDGRDEGGSDDDDDDGIFDGRSELDDGMLSALASDLPSGVARTDNDLYRAMDHLVSQYKRATVDETYYGPDSVRAPEALDGVRKAAARHFESDGDISSRFPPTDSHGNNIGEVESEEDEADEDYATAYATVLEQRVADKWDCDTILSTYTNVDNHPSVIDDGPGGRRMTRYRRRDPIIRLDPRTSLPVVFLSPLPEDVAEEDDMYYAERTDTAVAHVSKRDASETAEEKRARKSAAKVAMRLRRAEKSATKKGFAEENKRQAAHEVRLGKSKVAVRF
jgi:protein LTV1